MHEVDQKFERLLEESVNLPQMGADLGNGFIVNYR